MPITPTFPGVYIEEIPSGVRTITGVATSITAFIGRALRGPINTPTRIQSFADFERVFGGLWSAGTLGYALQHFFLHGGTDAVVVRVFNGDQGANTASILLPTNAMTLEANNAGDWGNRLQAIVDHDTRDAADANLFNLIIQETNSDGDVLRTETFLNVSTDAASSRFAATVLDQESTFVNVDGAINARPDAAALDGDGNPIPVVADGTGGDGNAIDDNDILGSQLDREGLFALDDADLFNLLVIPPLERDVDVANATWAAASIYCQNRRALLIIDPPASWTTVALAEAGVNALRTEVGNSAAINAAVYFPRLVMADPLNENRSARFAPSGALAGIYARTDAQRGVWKAPAGQEASLVGVRELTRRMTDAENGILNPLGLNALRTFPVTGNLVWGARTLAGADRLASEWKYIPIRRLALFLQESLFRGTQWVVFEPNDEPLWAQIRLNIGAFMQNLFRQGAFQGSSPREAYFVKVDQETTTQNDIDRGIVNIMVGFAPLKPAEFVIIQIQQMAGQIEV